MTRLALENLDDPFFSPDEPYEAAGTAIWANPRLAMPTVMKYAPDVAKLGSDVEGILTRHGLCLVRK